MAQKFASVGKLSIPLEEGGPVAPIDLGFSFTILNRADLSRNYVDAVTDDNVSLAVLNEAGVKGILVKCTTGSCTIKFNGIAQSWPLAAGGLFLWANPETPLPSSEGGNFAEITTTGPALIVFLAVG